MTYTEYEDENGPQEQTAPHENSPHIMVVEAKIPPYGTIFEAPRNLTLHDLVDHSETPPLTSND